MDVASHIKKLVDQETLDMTKENILVRLVSTSFIEAEAAMYTLKSIFKKKKSSKIMNAVTVLKCFVINCGEPFHTAFNNQLFQMELLELLNRLRGYSTLYQSLTSNVGNWIWIEKEVLWIYLVWADAFAQLDLDYPNITKNYKRLKGENIEFPERKWDEEITYVIETKKKIQEKKEREEKERKKKEEESKKKEEESKLDLDALYLKLSSIKEEEKDVEKVFRLIKEIKKSIEIGKPNPEEENHWEKMKEMAIEQIEFWESKNQSKLYSSSIKYPRKFTPKKEKMNRSVFLDLEKNPEKEDVVNTSLDDDTKEDWYNADEHEQETKKEEEWKDINLMDL